MNDSFSMFLSLFLFAVSIYLYRKTNASIVNRLLFSVLVFTSIIFYLFYAIANYFTGKGIDSSVIFHLKYGLAGAGFLEYWKLIAISIVFIILGLVFLYWIFWKRAKSKTNRTVYVYAAFLLILLSLFSSPATSDLNSILFQRSRAIALNKFYKQLQESDATDFYKFYRLPYIKQIAGSKNLVLVYTEGLEQTYFNEAIFPGLIKGLRELQSKSTYFTNVRQVDGTGWTIGGFVASQSGIPLFTPSDGNSMSGMDEFLPSAVSLGDLLHKEGYHLAYYGGANLDFAGKGKFYSTHKFDEIYGREELLPKLKDKSYRTWWGLYDDSLFDLAYQRFVELSETYDKFGLFLLTLDTHHPDGHPSKSCQGIIYKDGSNAMLNAVAGSDYLITKFVNKIMKSPYGAKTVVVVASDHLALKNTASELLNKAERRNLFMVIEPGGANKATKKEKLGSTLDVGVTILPFIGYKGAIGLGRNLADPSQLTTEIEYIHKNLYSWEPSLSRFWNFPKIQEFIEIDIANRTMNIDGRKFTIPALVELNTELETTLKFQFPFYSKKRLVDYVLWLDKDTPFLLIDECKNTNELDETLGQTGFCLIAGKGNNYYKTIRIKEHIRLTAENIRRFTVLCLPSTNCFQVHRIAHAGGGVGGKTYTNRFAALNQNIKNGFLYFELDFNFTKDGQLVCIHDWQGSFKEAFGFEAKERPTLEEFKRLVKNTPGSKNCTLQSLITWMKQNPSSFIITDVKENNFKALQIMSEKIPDFKKRIIPQIYYPDNYSSVKKMGYKQIIWTLYRYNGTNDDVLKWVDKFKGSFAITMPKNRASSNLARELAKKHIPTYVHTINTLEERNKFINEFGVTEIYTDFLLPNELIDDC